MRPSKTSQATPPIKRRLRWAVGVLVALLVTLVVKVGHLQTVSGDEYRAAGLDARVRTTTLRAERGSLFDRNGREISMSVPKMTLYADPTMVVDAAGTARAIAGLMQFDAPREQKLADALAAKASSFTFVARQIDPARAKAVTDLRLPGVGAYKEPDRMVLDPSALAVVGTTDTEGVGIAGLEAQYNDVLTGKDGRFVREQDKDGRSIPGASNLEVDPVPGNDLVLTLDRSIQFQLNQTLLSRVRQVGARGGTAIVMNTKTGDVYAMANIRRRDDGTYSNSGNFAAVEAHETGSTAKVFSIAAALNEGAVTPESVFYVPGVQKFDEYVIRDAYPHPTKMMPVREILVKSSNLGTVLTAQRVSTSTLESYLHAFGFGDKTALDFPDESAGILKPADKWQGTEKITVAYGYGFASTSLQLASAVNVIANNGVYVAPRLVRATIDAEGRKREVAASSTRPVLTQETATQMNLMMRDVVCFGTGTLGKIPGLTVAGKTGTGYKVQKDGTYGSDQTGRKYFATFVGFLPAEDSQVTILVSIDEPDAGSRDRFGGTAAAPVFSDIGAFVARELRIRPPATTEPCARVNPYPRSGESGH
ncbi:MAG: penicillin-binding protein 2 [Actinobacteria bacterium]|nr:penicillin-binding protein 2 [Actinomycetota bacterium]